MIYEFSDLILDLDRRLLSRGGVPVKLTKLSFRVLQTLVQAAPALVSHDDLIDQVWGSNRVITPENLSQRMKTLRQSLGDNPNEPRYVEGVRGEGYRLVPEVKELEPGGSSSSTGRAWPRAPVAALVVVLLMLFGWFAINQIDRSDLESAVSSTSDASPGSAQAVESQQPAIAILPFANMSADPSHQHFVDGIHDDLLTRISNIRELKTISRTSVMTYRDSDKRLGSIAKELGASTILEGGVQRSGDQVRINLQLIDAETDGHMWAKTYTRSLTATNVFTVQAEITEAVAVAMQAILSEDEQEQVEKLPTTNLQALDAYFKGNHFYNQATSEGYTNAIVAYTAAVEFDPAFSLAYSKHALALLNQIWNSGMPVEAQIKKSRPLIDKAILLDPQSSEAFTALGAWHAHAGDTAEAEQAYEKAMVLGPNNVTALVNYGNLLHWGRGDPVSAFEYYAKASELDPQNISITVELAIAMKNVGQTNEAIRMMEGVIDKQPNSAAAYRTLAEIYSNGKYRHDKGIKAMRRAFELDPSHPMNSYLNATMHWRLGDYDNTALWMNHIAKLVPDSEEAHVYRGWAFIAQRDFTSAREEFTRSKSGSGFYWVGIFYLAGVDTSEGRPDEAIKWHENYAAGFDGRKTNTNFHFGISAIKAYQALGEQEKAQALIDELIATIKADPGAPYHDSAVHDASLYVFSGQNDAAIEILEAWVNQGGATSILEQDIRHGLSVLADDPRYQSILRTVNDRLSVQMANLARWEANGEMLPIPNVVKNPE